MPISQAQDDLQQWIAGTDMLEPIFCTHNAASPWAKQRMSWTDNCQYNSSQASLPVTTHLYTENKLAEMTSNLR